MYSSPLMLPLLVSLVSAFYKKSTVSHSINKVTHVHKRAPKSSDNHSSQQKTSSAKSSTHADWTNGSSSSLERELQLALLRESHPMVRPVLEKDRPVVVTFGFTLVQVVSLEEHKQCINIKVSL